MTSVATHLVQGSIIGLFSSIWFYSILLGTIILLLLVFYLLKKKKKSPKKLQTSKHSGPKGAEVPQMLSIIKKTKSPVLLAASSLSDLPVTIPVNLAVSLAKTGKCLLIDLDSKRDALAKVFDVDSSKIDFDLKISPVSTEFENVFVWPAGYFDLLKQMNLRSLLKTANEKFDHILLYAPYLTVLADRKQIASCSRQAIVFSKNGQENTLLHNLLETSDCKILFGA